MSRYLLDTNILAFFISGEFDNISSDNSQQLHEAIEKDFYIEILPFTKQHTKALSKLQISDRHNDPFDHAIISQAIAEKLTLVSSDRKFEEYTPQKLNFVFNKR